jgi:Fic family protein
MPRFFTDPADMEPLLPEDPDGGLTALGWEMVRRAERLGAVLHPVTAAGLARLVRVMNSYYTHLIEGHGTKPADLEAVLRGRGEGSRERRDLQQLHFAHMAIQDAMTRQLAEDGAVAITSSEFLQSLHRRFYAELPASARMVDGHDGQSHPVESGAWRTFNVSVGRHLAPAHEAVPAFMARLEGFYLPQVRDTGAGLVACAAAHHRLVWIHPWADGNGRVARLFTQAWLIRTRVDAHGLWSVSRGLARNLEGYRVALANADEKRRNDFDGRGYLSQAALKEFCRFFLATCLDQLDYMNGCLAVETLERRITGYATLRESTGDWPAGSGNVLRDVCLRGEIARGDVPRLIGKSPRTAQTVIQQLLKVEALTTTGPKGPLRLGWPPEALPAWLPGLFS